MLPILLDLKFVKIYTLGVFLVLALFWGMFFLWRNIKLTSHKEEEIFDALFFSLIGGLFVSRLIYVVLNFEDFGLNILKFILINGYPGLSLIGLISGFIASLSIILALKKINFLEIADYFVEPAFLALTIGKIGSFFAGSDVGTKTNFIISIKYIGFSGFRHIVAIYEAALYLAAFYVSYRILMAIRRKNLPSGFAFYFFIFFFSLTNLLLDFLKENHLYFLGRSINLVFSAIFVFLFGAYFLYFFRKQINLGIKKISSELLGYVRQIKPRNHKKIEG